MIQLPAPKKFKIVMNEPGEPQSHTPSDRLFSETSGPSVQKKSFPAVDNSAAIEEGDEDEYDEEQELKRRAMMFPKPSITFSQNFGACCCLVLAGS